MHKGLIVSDLSQPWSIWVDEAVMSVANEILDGCIDVVPNLLLLLLVELDEALGERLTALLHTLRPTKHVGAEGAKNANDHGHS